MFANVTDPYQQKTLAVESVDNMTKDICGRGDRRFVVNIMRSSRDPEQAALDMLSDIEAWLRKSLPHYRHSMRVKTKAQGIREYTKACYTLIEEFFKDLDDQQIVIPPSARVERSSIEKYLTGDGSLPDGLKSIMK